MKLAESQTGTEGEGTQQKPRLGRFGRDVVWNLASVLVLGVSGFALNVIIGRYYGPETFGVFSQVLGVYYIFSQLAVGGFVFSALSIAAEHAEDRRKAGQIVTAALLLTGALAAAVCAAAWGLSGWIGRLLESPAVARGILWTIPGLWCFALNKVLLFSLNGLRHMRFYAVANALRFVLILVVLIALTAARADGATLPLCLSAGEAVLLPVLLGYFYWKHPLDLTRALAPWLRRHLHFGGVAFFSGLLMDANLKVDVLLLGYFLSDRVVGIYNFAAMLAIEGLLQFVVVIQTNMNPVLTRLKLEGRMGEVRGMIWKNARLLCPAMAVLSGGVWLVYPRLTLWLTGNPAFADGRIYFAVLMAGIVIAASYLPFSFLLNQWGRPGWFMVFLVAIVATNAILNVIFIKLWGALGSAMATAVAYVLTVLYLRILTRRVTGVDI